MGNVRVHGYLKNDKCNRNDCEGIIDEHDNEGHCSCHCGHPPCSNCVDDRHYCPVCGWEGIEEQRIIFKNPYSSLINFPNW